jgi:hypothetical protein
MRRDNNTTKQPSGFTAVDKKAKSQEHMSFKTALKRGISNTKQALAGGKQKAPGVLDQTTSRPDLRTANKNQRRKDRMGDDYKNTDTKELVQLHHADEMKIRQLAKRLNAEQAGQLGNAIMNILERRI